jgi:hypothetical protein
MMLQEVFDFLALQEVIDALAMELFGGLRIQDGRCCH